MSHALFLSDLHLQGPHDGRTPAVLDCLATRARDADTVYLVGDVFDFWLGYESVTFRPYFSVLRRLAELVEAGKRVVIFSGNHDPDPGGFLAELGLEVHEGPLTETIDGVRVRIEHGDTIDPRGLRKRLLCKLVRARPVRAVARAAHPEVMWRLAQVYGRALHAPGYHEGLPSELITDYFPAQVRAGADVLVMGHYHRAVHHRASIDGRAAAYFVLGDWIAHRTYLRCRDGEFDLMRYQPDGQDTVVPEGDHAPVAL